MRNRLCRTSEYLSRLQQVSERYPDGFLYPVIFCSVEANHTTLCVAIPEVTGRLKTIEEEPKLPAKMAETPVEVDCSVNKHQ